MKKTNLRHGFIGLCLLLFVFVAASVSAAGVSLTFDHFYDHEELSNALKALKEAYPQFMTLEKLGTSYQGREIWGVILNNPQTGPAKHKSGFYIDGNIHGNEIQGTEVALYAIWYLLTNHGKTEYATRLLDERAFYVIPSMNPDARDYFINKPTTYRTGLIPRDDDRDGLLDEDSPDDLNGDGVITMMRKKDPNGRFKAHPTDKRIMISVLPGEKGEYSYLGEEGIDNDGDGFLNEDDLGGYDMNRNYGYNWQPPYVQMGAGDYPFCFPEMRATRDFLMDNPNIMGAQCFHNYGGMILRGPGAMNLGEYPRADIQVYDYIGKKGENILPGYEYLIVHKDLYVVYGGSIDFLFCTLGIFTFTNELDIDLFNIHSLEQIADEGEKTPEERQQEEMLQEFYTMFFYDNVMLGETHIDWEPYDHPLYGEIEIGGVTKFGRRVPPLFQLPDTCHRNAAFCFFHADQLPLLEFDTVKVKKTASDLYQIDICIKNTRITPTISTQAKQKKLHRLDRLHIEGKNIKLLAAGNITDLYRGTTDKIETQGNIIWIEKGIPGFGQTNLRLLVKGKGDVRLAYDSLKGGYYSKNISLK